jgi:lipase maturation factor 1
VNPSVWLGGRSDSRSYAFGTWLFLRLLGVVYLCAFWSLGTQVRGLIGVDGILPAQELMLSAHRWADAGGLGPVARFFALPTVCWLGASDRVLLSLCAMGVALSLLQIAGMVGALVLPLLWLLYLSLSGVCGEFLSFQWDALLLETGLLALVLAPWTLAHRPGDGEPRDLSRWLIWWLLFRLTFASGVVKLTSGDPLWRGLTAVAVHYETLPLPTPLGWYAFHLPAGFQQFSTAAVLMIELLVPWAIFTTRGLRHVAGVVLVVLQLLIALTGNYAFFNLLTIALSLTLLDDAWWPRWGRPYLDVGAWLPARRLRSCPVVLLVAVAVVTVPASLGVLASQARIDLPGSAWLRSVRVALAPFRSVNAYGLFAVMTPTRPELTVEGSIDGETWQPYEFKDKPGDLRRAPPWVAPHQPRLDWQMWFAALDRFDASSWLERFCHRLLEGSPAVLDLLAENPFPDAPPRFVRVRRAQYHVAALDVHRRERVWWTREEQQPYSPVMSLSENVARTAKE